MKKIFTLVVLFVGVIFAFQVYALPSNVTLKDGTTMNVAGIEEFEGYGNLMEGSKVKVVYEKFGYTDIWEEIEGTIHGGEALDEQGKRMFSLSLDGDSWYVNWLLENTSYPNIAESGLVKLVFTGINPETDGRTVFDVYDYDAPETSEFYGTLDTPGSRRGHAFEVTGGTYNGNVSVTYKDIVALNGTKYGDLYSKMILEFDGPLMAGDTLEFKADTDIIIPVPEPGTVLLLGMGILGLLGYARKRK